MNKSQALHLKHGDIVHHKTVQNADGTPARGRVNGKVKLWKRSPGKFLVPMKHGLYDYFYIDQDNYLDFTLA